MQNTQHLQGTPVQGTSNPQQQVPASTPSMNAPDETNYNMPPDSGAPVSGSWIYGDPNLNYSGQMPSSGVSVYTMQGIAPASDPNNRPMPIPGMNGSVPQETVSSSAAQSERMKNPVNMAATHMPANNAEAYQASLRSLMHRNIGYFVVITFLVGTQQSVTWQGILHTVGSDYIVLYQPDYERYISCDFHAIKFVQFHNVKGVPYCAASRTWQGQNGF